MTAKLRNAAIFSLVAICGIVATNTVKLQGMSEEQGPKRRLLEWITGDECQTKFEGLGDGSLACICYILAISYTFLALAVVVDEYFVLSIEVLLKKLQISDDVAGAIFMAGGTSAAELFSNLVDTFVYRSNIGFGVIYGTVVFNIFVGIGYAAYICPSDVKQCDWRPLSRDTIWYCISIIFVVAFIWDKKVEWWESFILVLLYGGYVTSVIFQHKFEEWFCSVPPKLGKKGAVELEEVRESGQIGSEDVKVDMKVDHVGPAKEEGLEQDSVNVAEDDDQLQTSVHHESAEEPLGPCGKCVKILRFPIEFLMHWTIPASGTPENPTNKYMWSFVVACIWIAGLSWLMVKFATSIGCIIGVGPVLLGTTFLALGTSIPDSMSTIIAAKKGEGPMAVSNTLGSNIFDMQIAIGLPWLLYSWALGEPYEINHGNMAGPIVFLLYSAFALHFGLSLFGWKLRKRLGFVLMASYAIFIIYVFCEELA